MTTSTDLELTTPVNLRDLGGIPIADGVLRHGLAIRSDDLALIPADHAADLVARGLTTVIDLRSNDEVAITGRGPLAGLPVAYHHLSLIHDVGRATPTTSDDRAFVLEHNAMGEMYVDMVENAAPQIVSALSIIALAPGTTAFHCAAGRDRTGVLAASLLLALGADDDDIVTDYARTDANMAAIMERLRPTMTLLMGRLGVDWEVMTQASMPTEPMDASMRILLARLRERHGEALAPLRAAGLTDETIARLRQRAVAA